MCVCMYVCMYVYDHVQLHCFPVVNVVYDEIDVSI